MNDDEKLCNIRKGIDAIDQKIVQLLAERWDLVRAAGAVKRENDLPYWQKDRVEEVLASRAEWAEQHNVEVALIKDIFKLIVTSATELEQQGG